MASWLARAVSGCGSRAEISVPLVAGEHRIPGRMLDVARRAICLCHKAQPRNPGSKFDRVSRLVAIWIRFHYQSHVADALECSNVAIATH